MDYEILIRFLLAALWGGLVGMEREYRSKSAGFRTMTMISIGACFFTILSKTIGEPGNADRIASNIVTGIGFLGAGVIFRGENRINGITTAATIWGVAAVGMGIGAGYYFAAASASVLILIVLALLPYVEGLVDDLNQARTYSIQCRLSDNLQPQIEQMLKANRLKFKLTRQLKEGFQLSLTWQVYGHIKNHQRFTDAVLKDEKVNRFEY
jgi:putative Mg2+ transporter-C (MgtC) family protein